MPLDSPLSIARLAAKNRVVLPSEVVKALELVPGDYVGFFEHDGETVLRKVQMHGVPPSGKG